MWATPLGSSGIPFHIHAIIFVVAGVVLLGKEKEKDRMFLSDTVSRHLVGS